MDILEFHYRGKPFLITRASFKAVIPALKNNNPTGKYILITDDEGSSGLEIDEDYDELMDALATYEIEVCANDEDDEAA